MSEAVLSLGSNLDDRFGHLQSAVDGLVGVLRAVSPVYENPPWGRLDQPDFLNAVALVEAVDVDAWGWLRRAQALERAAGRRRTLHWGPRTLDVDVVTVDGVTSTDLELTLPHPGAHERVSVLLPWHDVDPAAVLPGHGPIAALLTGLDTSAMRRLPAGLDVAQAFRGAPSPSSGQRPISRQGPTSGSAERPDRDIR